MTYLRSFLAFWYDFLVGDRWELFVGPIVALVLVALMVRANGPAPLIGGLLFLLVSAVGALSVAWAMRA